MYKKLSIILLLPTVLLGCTNKLAEVPDEDLADTMYECRNEQSQSPGMAIRCDNITRECKRRRDEGRFVC